MSLAKQEFTNAGRSMLGRAQNGETLTITKIVVGDGSASQPSDLWPLVNLIDLKLNVTISSKNDLGNGTMMVEGSFRSDAAPAAFFLREAGVMAHIGAEADRLYSVSNVFADPPDYIDPAAPTIQAFKIKLVIDRIPTTSLIVQIGPSENVIGQNQLSDSQGPGWYKDALGNVLRFKRAIAGPRINLIEDANHDSVTIGVKTVTANLDLYVPLTYHNLPPGTDPSQLFPTIQAALDSVQDLIIPPAFFVTVHVDSGRITQSGGINLNHPNASQIKIIGQDVLSTPVNGSITRTGSLPNVQIVCNVGSLNGINVGDVVQLFSAPHAQLETAGYIISTRPTPTPNVTIGVYCTTILPPASTPALASTKLLIFPTQISCTLSGGRAPEPPPPSPPAVTAPGGSPPSTGLQDAASLPTGSPLDLIGVPQTQNACFQFNTGNNTLKNFGIRSTNGLGTAVLFMNTGQCENVVVIGFQYGFGIAAPARVVLLPICAANACQVGMSVGPGATAIDGPYSTAGWDKTVWSGNGTYGMWILGSFYSSEKAAVFVCSCPTGIRVDGGYFLHGCQVTPAVAGVICGFNDNGVVCAIIGRFLTALNALNAIQANNTLDCRAVQGSQIAVVHNASIPPNAKLDPDLQVLGVDGSYISILSP